MLPTAEMLNFFALVTPKKLYMFNISAVFELFWAKKAKKFNISAVGIKK